MRERASHSHGERRLTRGVWEETRLYRYTELQQER